MIKIKRSKNKQFYFTVNAKNGRVLLTSETYKRKAGVFNAIRAFYGVLRTPSRIVDTTTNTGRKLYANTL
jgi:uncharacterized protein YegP (UPF0339 family)